MMRHEWYPKTVLSNTLRVISAAMPHMESVALGIWVAAGGRYEPPALCGISHFLEHLMFKGTTHRTARQIKEAIEGLGGSMNAFTDSEYTCVYAQVPATHATVVLDVLLDMVRSPRLAARDIERERQVILEEIKMYLDIPMQHVQDLLNALMWPNQPLGRVLAGTPASVARIRARELAAYHRRFYTPANLVVAAAGPISHRLLVEQVQAALGHVPPGRAQRFRRASHRQRRPRVHCAVKETEQSHAVLGFSAFPRHHPQIHGLNLLHVILGGNMSSRLFRELRETRGLAYDIGTSIKRYRDAGAFTISAGVEHRKLVQALRVITQELARIRRQPVSADECDRAKEFYAAQLALMTEETVDQMCWLGEGEMLFGHVDPLEHVIEDLRRVTPRDVQRVAGQVLHPARVNVAMIGPLKPSVEARVREVIAGARA